MLTRRGKSKGSVIPREFFGVHYRNATTLSTPQTPYHPLNEGTIRFWDAEVTWRSLELTKGDWNSDGMNRLTQLISMAEAHDLQIIMTLGQPPNYATGGIRDSSYLSDQYNALAPTSNQDWVDYISKLLDVLPVGTIYEVWNEPNLTGFWLGSKARLAELHILAWDTIKARDPSAKICSAPPSSFGMWSYLTDYLTPVVIAKTDIIGIHSYFAPKQPEQMLAHVDGYRGALRALGASAKPLMNTEYTWHDYIYQGVAYQGDENERMDHDFAAAYLIRSFLCNWLAGVERAIFFGPDQFYSMLRLVTDLADPVTLTNAGLAFRSVAGRLTGGRLWGFKQLDKLYVTSFIDSAGDQGKVLWTQDDKLVTHNTTIYSNVVDVLGTSVAKASNYQVSHSPVFCYLT